jgi:peptide/nickel transport system ATP-binding protein
MRSVPRLDRPRDRKLETIEGLPPNLLAPPAGCRFASRCPFRIEKCAIDPPYHFTAEGQRSACHRAEELGRGLADATQATPAPPLAVASAEKLLEVRELRKHFQVRSRGLLGTAGVVRAVEDVSFAIERGRTLGLVGESGCGKTTIGRTILRLEEATGGEVRFDGEDLVAASNARMKELRTKIQVIFQDPFSSLNPRMSIGDIIAEPLVFRRGVKRREARERAAELLVQVGLYADMAERYPHQLSGGQRQRVGIARALAMDPSFIVCDEPVSALDVSIQGQIINLLDELQERLGLTYLFIAHDLAVVRHISHRIVVMYLGRVMEMADRDELYAAPLHPYTRALLDAAPVPDPKVERARRPRALSGELPSPLAPPPGCVFNTRCPMASDECRRVVPEVREIRPGHFAACIKI